MSSNESKGILTDSYHIGRVIIGLGTLVGMNYIYFNYYIVSTPLIKSDVGGLIVLLLFFGVVMLLGGLHDWQRIHRKKEKLEELKIKLEYEKKKGELKELKYKK